MFKFRSLELVHWDFWERFTLPFDADVVTIVGPNGSGKTTLLDALRTLLGVECSSGRDYKRYVRRNAKPFSWLRAVVSNERSDSGRLPFFPSLSAEITLACRIQKKGGDWKRQYMVADGNVPIEVLNEEGAELLGVRDYQTRLANAGVTPAIRRVLALEQGATDKLCDYSPKQLLDLVFDSFGDGEVLDNYRQAKHELNETKQELDSLEDDLGSLGIRLNDMRGRVNNLREWQNRKQELDHLECEILPRAELAELREQICAGRKQFIKQEHLLGEKQQQLAVKRRDTQVLTERLLKLQGQKNASDEKISELKPDFEALKKRAWQLEATLQRKQELEALVAQKQQGVDEVPLTQERAELLRSIGRRENDRDDACAKIDNLKSALRAERAGHRALPSFVETFRQALNEAQIGHCLLTEIVEVLDPLWQTAIEGVLRSFAHVVLLEDPNDRQRAWALGTAHRYCNFVVPERSSSGKGSPGSLLEVVEFKQLPPSWLPRLLDRVQRVTDVAAAQHLPSGQDWVTLEGYHREHRGGRYIGVEQKDFQFGAAAQLARIQSLTLALKEQQQLLLKLQHELEAYEQRRTQIENLLEGVDADSQLAAEAGSFARAADQWPQVQSDLARQTDALSDLQSEQRLLSGQISDLRAEISGLNSQIHIEQGYLDREQAELADHRASQKQRLRHYRVMGRKLPRAWRNAKALENIIEKYGKAVSVRRQIELIGQDLDAGEWETDESLETIYTKMEQDYHLKEESIKTRRFHYRQYLIATNNAREQYINVLKGTVRLYSANIRKLGKLAEVDITITPPYLDNDDLSLTKAGLAVSFSFDQKSADEASGGQQVMKSLILLIGLLMEKEESGGFVFVDEPFAHLDILNIDRVSNFLLESGAQYVLTTPNTQNTNVFKPSDLSLVTQKRRHPELWAPPIAFIRRQTEGDNVS